MPHHLVRSSALRICRRAGSRGFTLIETMITIAIIAVVSFLAAPNILGRIPAEQLEHAQWQMASDLRAARIGAISESTIAQFTIDAGARTYDIWVDRDRNGARTDSEVTQHAIAGSGLTVSSSGNTLRFGPTGRLLGGGANLRITLTHPKAGPRHVFVMPSGLVDHY